MKGASETPVAATRLVNRCTARLRDIRMMIDETCRQLECSCQTRQRILPTK